MTVMNLVTPKAAANTFFHKLGRLVEHQSDLSSTISGAKRIQLLPRL